MLENKSTEYHTFTSTEQNTNTFQQVQENITKARLIPKRKAPDDRVDCVRDPEAHCYSTSVDKHCMQCRHGVIYKSDRIMISLRKLSL